MIGLVVDGGLLLSASRHLQHVTDAATTAAATEKQQGKSNEEVLAVAKRFVHEHNLMANAEVTLNSPPVDGPRTGSPQFVEVIVQDHSPSYFINLFGGPIARRVAARAVAGFEPSTAGAAIVILDPNPPEFSVSPLPSLVPTPLPAILGGLEVLGLGRATVNGAILVNTEWGGRDENDDSVGEPAGPFGLSHAISATPLLNLTRLRASDIRVVGGVDNPHNYGPSVSGAPEPLRAGRLPVPDPYRDLPAPTITADPVNVHSAVYGGVTVAGLPLISPPVTLEPGVYDWIQVISGRAIFKPGIYIIRGNNPLTQLALNVVAGQVQAAGVMFYITDSAGYTPANGTPDATDGSSAAPSPAVSNISPCAVINIGLLGSTYNALNAPGSPFHNILIYQRRHDRRPIILVQENLLGAGQLAGTVYSKWGHVVLAGKGTYDARFVVGTMRIVALLDLEIRPSVLLPPAQDVYLVE
jgi:hypothetical protein